MNRLEYVRRFARMARLTHREGRRLARLGFDARPSFHGARYLLGLARSEQGSTSAAVRNHKEPTP